MVITSPPVNEHPQALLSGLDRFGIVRPAAGRRTKK
jgi:hypothetical protein